MQQEELQKAYDAGNYSRLNAGWHASNNSAEFTDRNERDTVRARARDLERNSDMANSVILAFRRNVVGSGFALQARTGNAEIDDRLEEIFEKWSEARNCDVTGEQCFNEMLRMAVVRKKVDGGILFKKCYSRKGYVPFQLQLFEVDELSNMYMLTKHDASKGYKTAGGIEYDKNNRAVGYWIQKYSIDGMELSMPEYVDAKDMIFYYAKRRPSQVREFSDLAPTISRIRDANEFITAVSIKERIAACLAVFIKKVIPTAGLGRSGITASGERESYAGKTLSPGMIQEMNAGDEIQVVDPKNAASDSSEFLKTQQRLIGAGQGLSYEATSRDMSKTNYSSARQGSIEDDLTYDDEKNLLITKVMDEVYETMVISAVLAGVINIPDFWENKDRYLKHVWVANPKRWIDPQKESNANKIALMTGQKTFQQIAAEQGRDWKEQIDDMAAAVEYAKEKGINLGGVLYGQYQDGYGEYFDE
jgi:lambda family phage portal protein